MIANQVTERRSLIQALEARRESRIIVYVTGDRPGLETQISAEAVELFVDHLDAIWPAKKISLFLYTRGGDTAAAWRLINLLRTFCDELEVIVPSLAMSAGTLISLGANTIVMTKQAALGPIDPSLNNPLNPIIPGSNQRAPVSVEAVQGFLDIAKSEMKLTDQSALSSVLSQLSTQIHPLVLGQIFRSRTQIRDLAIRLLAHQALEQEQIEKVVSFLCSDSGSHDHTLNRREARELGLRIENPCQDFYKEIQALYKHIVESLELRAPYGPDTLLGTNQSATYCLPRAVIESLALGSHQFLSEGILSRVPMDGPNGALVHGLQDRRTFEAWRKVS